MKMRVFQDWVRVCAFLGCFLVGFSTLPAYSADELCDTGLNSRIRDELQRNATAIQDAMHQAIPGPADRDQIANTPCVSQQLNNVVGQFSNAGSGMLGGLGNAVNINGNVGGILNKFFQSGFESLNEAAGFMPAMLNFQTQASSVLGGLLGSLGGGASNPFSSDLCGMMVDMIVKFVQCQLPMQLPDIGNLNLSLNIDMPDNCAGNALRDSIYAVSNSRAMETLGQPLNVNNGSYSAGTAPFRSGN